MLRLTENQKEDYYNHLISLSKPDRVLRFNGTVKDESIRTYVDEVNWDRDIILAIYDTDMNIVAASHVWVDGDNAEIGVSVLETERGKGLGFKLFQSSINRARNKGATHLSILCSATNNKMMNIARKHGLEIHRDFSDAEGFMEMDRPNIITLFTEQNEERRAIADYIAKKNLKFFKDMVFTPLM